MKNHELVAVVARADNGVIGRDGTLPWHIPADLKHFKRMTIGKPMIMGRRTFDSLPGLLPNRRHIVLTRDVDWRAKGAEPAYGVIGALDLAAGDATVIGGGEILALFSAHLTRIELTEVHAHVAGDTKYAYPGDEWQQVARVEHPAEGGTPALSFVTLARR